MIFDGSNLSHVERAKELLGRYISQGATFELTRKKKRSTSQNSYLHVLLSFVAIETGEKLDYVKQVYYKKLANADLFVIENLDTARMVAESYLRSSADLSSEEMTISIERFRNWASLELGMYLPEPDDKPMIDKMDVYVKQNKQFLI